MEELPLKDEEVPKSDPSEPLATSGLPEADKKRVVIGSAIGGGIFLGVLIAIIVLVSTESVNSNPTPPPPIKRYPHHNPYFLLYDPVVQDREMRLSLINRRQELEADTDYYSELPGYIPIVKKTPENDEPERLVVTVTDYDEHFFRILYDDPEYPRWHVPDFGNYSDPYSLAAKFTHPQTGFKLRKNVNDSFQWYYGGKRSSLLMPLISTFDCRFQYFDKYIEFEAILERDYIYGMGERIESFYLKNDNYTLWNRYLPYTIDGNTENGMYSSHPFFLNRLSSSQNDDFLGVFMRNSNAMTFSMWDHASNGTMINYKMVGGTIDLYVFHTADPQYILRKYHSVIGRPYLPAIWAMGLQYARAGYTVADFEKIIDKSRELHLAVDALWADKEMNENYVTFTVNSGSFKGIKELVKKMHDSKESIDMHFVAIANPGLHKNETNKYYMKALEDDVLIMSATHFQEPYTGYTYGGQCVWLDFFVYKATLLWGKGILDLYQLTDFDGIWISENEVFNQGVTESEMLLTEADYSEEIPNPFHNKSEFNYLQFRPTIDLLDIDTISMAAYHHEDDIHGKQFFTHNLFGLQISNATFIALSGFFEDKRFLLASRSTWPGSGRYASHWLDGNYATWDSMISSIAGILNFNMFGIPHVGAPIGGFFGDASEELLIRWYQLGAFYPLMLTYTGKSTNNKEAFAFENAIPAIRNALNQRYSLIRFMYTKMFEAHAWGGAVVHPLFFDFPNDTKIYTRDFLDKTFMWANTLYIAPSLAPSQNSIKVYFPNWRWYDLRTFELIANYIPGADQGREILFNQPLGYINVFVKGGSIIPYQKAVYEDRTKNIKDLNKLPAVLIVAPDHNGKAIGSMIVDNEGTLPVPDIRSDSYRHYTFTYMNQIFRINKLTGFDFVDDYEFDYFWELIILDIMGKEQVDYVCMMDMYMKKRSLEFDYKKSSPILAIHDNSTYKKISMLTLESIVWGTKDQNDFCGFQAYISKKVSSKNDRVLTGTLETSDPDSYKLKYEFTANAINNYIVYLVISRGEKDATEWKVPDVVPQNIKTQTEATRTLDGVGFDTSPVDADFYFEMSEEDDPQDFLLTTKNQPFVYLRNFIHFRFMVAGRHIFGLGERVAKFELTDGVYSIWNYDAMHEETGTPPGNNMYGSHPFYLIHTHNPRDFAGVFILNSNPMDVRIKHIGMQTQIDHMLSGGIIELFFLGKGSAEQVLREYHYLIGKPTPLPFWVFGYHQSRWGYRNIAHLTQVVAKFKERGIPLDGVWMDKDFMQSYKSFTIDTKKWFGLTEFVKSLHDEGKHFVAIVDAAIGIDDTYDVYANGLSRDVYIKSSFTGEPLVGITWAGYSVWVDFIHSNARGFWHNCLDNFRKLVDFDGIWLDMNEPSNFCDGECPDHITYHYYYFPLDYYDDLYYNPTHRPLEDNTVSMEALHSGKGDLGNEFNYHSLYGYFQSKITADYFVSVMQKRPFVISSSTFAGSGVYATHWLGDNYSRWQDMEYSIAGMLNFNMFGIPFVGANICGYADNAEPSMCARWMQLGAFYPFMRNHNSPDSTPQEPYTNDLLEKVSKKAIQMRYSLVRYLYTEYMHTVLRGGTMVRPLIFDYPEDNETYSIIDSSFMVGPALRITPIMENETDQIDSYFPNANWYHFQDPDYKKIMSYKNDTLKGEKKTLFASLNQGTMNVHARSGVIFPFQDINAGITNVLKVHTLPINLLVIPHHWRNGTLSVGEILYDTESHQDFPQEHQNIMMYLNGSTINFNTTSGKQQSTYTHADKYLKKLIILDAEQFSLTKSAKYEMTDGSPVNMKAPSYDREKQILTLEAVDETSMDITKIKKIYWQDAA